MVISREKNLAFLFLLIFSWCGLPFTRGHPSCCKHKLGHLEAERKLIDDPLDTPPPVWQGQPQYIDDPNDIKPEDWDDEDDGDWAPVQILNPDFKWRPRQIPNPNYIPPPSYWEKLRVELLATIPWVTLGVFITTMLSLIPLPLDTLKWWLKRGGDDSSSGMLGLMDRLSRLLPPALLGLATPLCSCGSLPLCAALLKQGVPFPSVLVFLTASQSAGLDSAAITFGLLGAPAMVGRLGGAIMLALSVGLACPSDSSSTGNKPESTGLATSTCHPTSLPAQNKSLKGVITSCLETATDIYPPVVLGLALSTAAIHFLPPLTSFVTSPVDGVMSPTTTELIKQELWMRLLLLGAALPLQLCEHTSVAFAAAIQKAGGSPGLAFSFLLSAPATNLSTILWVWNSGYSHRVLPILLALSSTALLLSYLVDASQSDLLAGEATGQMAQLPEWLVHSSPYIAGSMLVGGWCQKYINSTTSQSDEHGNCCSSDKAKTE